MKKLIELVLLAAVGWVVYKFITKGSGGPGFFDGGNQQIKEAWDNITGGAPGNAWNDFWGLHPGVQKNNPVTGNPIPDATMYPNDPGGWYNA